MVSLIAIIVTYFFAVSVKAQVNYNGNEYISNPSLINGNDQRSQEPCKITVIPYLPLPTIPNVFPPEISNRDLNSPTGEYLLPNPFILDQPRSGSSKIEEDENNLRQILLNQAEDTNKNMNLPTVNFTPKSEIHDTNTAPETDQYLLKSSKNQPLPASTEYRRNLNNRPIDSKLVVERPNVDENEVLRQTKMNELYNKNQGPQEISQKYEPCNELSQDNSAASENLGNHRRFLSDIKAGTLTGTQTNFPSQDNFQPKQISSGDVRNSLDNTGNEATKRNIKDDKLLLVSSSGRICFACSTLTDPTCQEPNRATTTVKYCHAGQESCLKKSFSLNSTLVTVRDCGTTCQNFNVVPNPKDCSECHMDLCNGSHALNGRILCTTSLLLIIAAIKNVY